MNSTDITRPGSSYMAFVKKVNILSLSMPKENAVMHLCMTSFGNKDKTFKK